MWTPEIAWSMTQGIICHSDIKGTGPKMRWKIIPEVRGQCLDVSRFAHVYNKNSEWSLDLIGGYEFSHSLRRCELDQMELQVHNWLKEAGPDESRWIMVKLYVHGYTWIIRDHMWSCCHTPVAHHRVLRREWWGKPSSTLAPAAVMPLSCTGAQKRLRIFVWDDDQI